MKDVCLLPFEINGGPGAAFDPAGRVVIAPPNRKLPAVEQLDTGLLARQVAKRGIRATAADSVDKGLVEILDWARPGDGIVLLSNGSFGGLKHRVVEALR